VALRNGRVLLSDFTSDTIRGATPIQGLARKIKVSVNPELADNDIASVRIAITMVNGQTVTHTLDTLKGSPSKPLSFDECAAKFKNCLEYSERSELIKNSDRIVDFIFNLEKKGEAGEIFDYLL